MKTAGATKAEFKSHVAHSQFVHQAIKNATNGVGVFQGFEFNAKTPEVGDIIQHNRRGNRFSFNFAKTHSRYESHSFIVIEVGEDTSGKFAFCICGNEDDSVRRSIVRQNPQALIKQRDGSPFISIIKNLK